MADRKVINGISASPGIALGKVKIYSHGELNISKQKFSKDESAKRGDRFRQAVESVQQSIKDMYESLSDSDFSKEAKIFESHLLILEDPYLIEETILESIESGIAVEFLFSERINNFIKTMEGFSSYYLKDRQSDIRNVAVKIINEYLDRNVIDLTKLDEDCLVVTKEIPSFEVTKLQNKHILGLVMEIGGRTSHAAIMARAFEIPTVVGVEDVLSELNDDDFIIIDGAHGIVIIHPNEEDIEKYSKLRKNYLDLESRLKEKKGLKPITTDGRKIDLSANIGLIEEVKDVIENDAKGIGLFRTEFLFLNRQGFPTEEEQFLIYKRIVSNLAPYPVIIRTIDLGGDKLVASSNLDKERNPFLGVRAIRLSLAYPYYFKQQLRAILRASAFGNIKIMYPMITTIEEVLEVNKIFDEVKKELTEEKVHFNGDIECGIMIETPSAAIESDNLAKHVDFFSIGTNDLTQYTLAVDRVNKNVAYLFKQLHPAVLKLMKMTVDNAHKNDIWCGICGELAGEPYATIMLTGMGFDELSTSAFILPEIKSIIRGISYTEAKDVADNILQFKDVEEIKCYIDKINKSKFPDYFRS